MPSRIVAFLQPLVAIGLLSHSAMAWAATPVQRVAVQPQGVRPRVAPRNATAGRGLVATLPSGRRVLPVGRVVGTGVLPTGVVPFAGGVAVLTSGPTPVQSVTLYNASTLKPRASLNFTARKVDLGETGAKGGDADSGEANIVPDQSLYQGLATGPGGRLYAAGGNSNDVIAMRMKGRKLVVSDRYRIPWHGFPSRQFPYRYQGKHGKPRKFYVDGICPGPGGRYVYATGLLANSLARIDVKTGHVDIVNAGPYPFSCVVTDHGHRVVVSDWGGNGLAVIGTDPFKGIGHIALSGPEGPDFKGAGPHPTAMTGSGVSTVWVTLSNADEIAEVDAASLQVRRIIHVAPYRGAPPGSYPDGIAVAAGRLFVANAGNNTVAVYSGKSGKPLGLVPTGWYPTALAAGRHALYVIAGKGLGAGANTDHAWPAAMINGLLQDIPLARASDPGSVWTRRALDGLQMTAAARKKRARENAVATAWLRKHIDHVVFILRENKTFDEELGRYKPAGSWADPHLALYDRKELPNLYKIIHDGALFVNFYVNGEVTAAAHQWTTGASESDWVQRTWPSYYSGRGIVPNPGWTQPLFKPGFNSKGEPKGDDPFANNQNLKALGNYSNPWISYPQRLYLFNDLLAHDVSFEDFGEFVSRSKIGTISPAMRAHMAMNFAGFDRMLLDTQRARVVTRWIGKRGRELPSFVYVWLPDDHTAGTNPCYYTPDFYVADNDLATARVIAALSRRPGWKHTLVFITEDDTQSGADHINALRSFLVMAGPWVKPGAIVTRHYSQVDVIRTIEAVLGLPPLSQWDANARVISGPWRKHPDSPVYAPIPETVPQKLNPGRCHSRWLNLRRKAGRDGTPLTRRWFSRHRDEVGAGPKFAPTELLSTPGPEMMREEWIASRGEAAWSRVMHYLHRYAKAHDAPLKRYLAEGVD